MPQRSACLVFLLPPRFLYRHAHVRGGVSLPRGHLHPQEPRPGKQALGSACGSGAAPGDGGLESVPRWDTRGQAEEPHWAP